VVHRREKLTGILLKKLTVWYFIILDSQNEYGDLAQGLEGTILTPGTDYTVRLSSLAESEILDLVPTLKGTLGYDLLAFSFLGLKREMLSGTIHEFGLNDLLNRMD
jgi:hypothetical protein